MNYRILGKTGFKISEIGLGTWQLSCKWGQPFDEKEAQRTLEAAVDSGINIIDTADIYNNSLSEQAIGKFLKGRRDRIYVVTKCGRGVQNHTPEGYTKQNMTRFIEGSLKRLGVEQLDLIQLHCPPPAVYYMPEVFDALEEIKKEGKIANYGVSVERIEEALKAIEFDGLATVQIIFNMFRLRPRELFFERAKQKNIGVLVRVPLASGMLTGKFGKDTVFAKEDHRAYNRHGESFDKGETFSGVDYDVALSAVEKLSGIFKDRPLAECALKFVLMHDAVSCVIPGASRAEQAVKNAAISDTPELTAEEMDAVAAIYEEYIKYPVHYLW